MGAERETTPTPERKRIGRPPGTGKSEDTKQSEAVTLRLTKAEVAWVDRMRGKLPRATFIHQKALPADVKE